jgi:hypothetical protein
MGLILLIVVIVLILGGGGGYYPIAVTAALDWVVFSAQS